ncbi:MAG: tetratricopeptide repeat protein [Leptolyngbyaceae cyanobacterium bins.349]|nr:tetratricopeptide repeat protein [Leptolyngbyaceae cyanobacterium bins.349]
MNPNERLISQLRQKQKELGLTERDTGLQEVAPTLAQNSARPEDLEFYEQMFGEMAQRQLPIRDSDRRELAYFQQVFHLSDEEVFEIEQRVMGELGVPSDPYDMEEPPPVSFPIAPPATSQPPTPGVTMPPQDTYSGEGSTTPTMRNKPAHPNQAAVQKMVQRLGEQELGHPIQSAETAGPAPASAPAASVSAPVDPTPQAQAAPVASEPAPASPPVPAVEVVTVQQNPQTSNPSTQVAPASAAPAPAPAAAQAVEASPPRRKFPYLERRVLLPLLFISLFLLTAGLVSWAMLRLYAVPNNPVDPRRSQQYIQWGTQKNQQGQHQEAIQDFDQAIRLNPNDANAFINRGYANHQAGNLNAAIDDYNKAIELAPNSAQAFSNRSHVRFEQGRWDDAVKDATRAIELNSNLPEAHVNLGNALFAQGDLDRAAQEFQTAIQLPASNRTKARAHNNRGNIFLARKQLQEAGQEYDQATQLDPEYADAFFNRGIAHERNQNFSAAFQDFTQAANLYQAQGNTRRSQDAQSKAERVKEGINTTPLPPATPNTQAI